MGTTNTPLQPPPSQKTQTAEEKAKKLKDLLLKQQALKKSVNKSSTDEKIKMNALKLKALQSINPNNAQTNHQKIQNEKRKQALLRQQSLTKKLTPYRSIPKKKENVSFTTTLFDTNHNVVQTKIDLPLSIPPKIATSNHIAANSKNWKCHICTFYNNDNETMKCRMCQKINKYKTNIVENENETKPIIKKQRFVNKMNALPTKQMTQTCKPKILNIAPKPIPSLIDYWKLNEKQNRKIDEKSLESFIKKEVNVFIDGMSKSLKSECNAIGISYINPFGVVDNEMIDLEEDLKWTQQVSAKYNVPWKKDFDLNAFEKVVAQCNE